MAAKKKNRIPPPIFPKWEQVIDKLYTTPPFVACGLGKESREHYRNQLKVFKKNFVFPIEEPEKMVQAFDKFSAGTVNPPSACEKEMFDKYSALNAYGNQFTLIGNANEMKFVQISENVKDILDLKSPEDFDLAKVCALNTDYELFNPFDVFHIIRLGEVILQTAGIKGIQVNPFEDTFNIEFRMGYKTPERCVTVFRECRLTDPREHPSGIAHMDVWRIVKNHDQFSHVKAIFTNKTNQEMNEVIRNFFFATNCALLGLTPRDAILANYFCNYSTDSYRDKLNQEGKKYLKGEVFGPEASSTLRRNLIDKINSRMVENTKWAEYKKEVAHWSLYRKCGQLGILSAPAQIQHAAWSLAKKR